MVPRLPLLAIALGLFFLHEPSSEHVFAALDPCASPANPIVCENSKPGSPQSEWDLPGGNPQNADLNIQGYATDISVNVGERVHFKVNTSASAYRIDIYRLGYYGGAGGPKKDPPFPHPGRSHNQPPRGVGFSGQTVERGNTGEINGEGRA